jgi:Coenzyme PQQ synthesis protein D (PqqD)
MLEPTIESHSIVCWSKTPVATEINGEIVLMNMDRDRCYGLGNPGSEVWRKIREPIEVSELCRQLESMYSAPIDTIQRDVLKMLQELAAEDLIELRPPE